MLIEFKPWHLDMLELTDSVRSDVGAREAGLLERLAACGLAFTVVAGEEQPVILGVVGAAPCEDWRACEVFVVAGEERRAHRVEFAKSVRRILDKVRGRFARIDALGKETPARWFEWLGFTRVANTPNRWSMVGVAST